MDNDNTPTQLVALSDFSLASLVPNGGMVRKGQAFIISEKHVSMLIRNGRAKRFDNQASPVGGEANKVEGLLSGRIDDVMTQVQEVDPAQLHELIKQERIGQKRKTLIAQLIAKLPPEEQKDYEEE